MTVNIFGPRLIVLNSIETATELLDKRSGTFSDRPEMTMFNDLYVQRPPSREVYILTQVSTQCGVLGLLHKYAIRI